MTPRPTEATTAGRRAPTESREDFVRRMTERMVEHAGVTSTDPYVFHARLTGDADSTVSRFYCWQRPPVVVDFFTELRQRDGVRLMAYHRRLADAAGAKYVVLPAPEAIPAPEGGEAFAIRPRPYASRDNNPIDTWGQPEETT